MSAIGRIIQFTIISNGVLEMSIGLKLLQATKSEVDGIRIKAEANLEVLLTNPVGIGEHCDIVAEVHNLVSTIVDSEDKLNVLSRKITSYEDGKLIADIRSTDWGNVD